MIRNSRAKRFSVVSTAVIAAALTLSTLPAQAADPGVTASEIKLGYSGPLTGSAGLVYGKLPGGMKAYFDHINANGGVYGRKINLIIKDDKYLPTLAATQTTNLVLRDNVFALVGALGTPTHTKAYAAASLAKKKANMTAALPRSFAFLDKGFLSSETRSTTASIAEFNNSIINT